MTSWKPLSLSKRFSQNGDNCQEWSIRGGLNTACGDKMMNYYSGTKYGASYWLEPFCNLKKNSENLIPRLESTDFKSWHNRHNDGWDEDFPCKFHHHWVTQGGNIEMSKSMVCHPTLVFGSPLVTCGNYIKQTKSNTSNNIMVLDNNTSMCNSQSWTWHIWGPLMLIMIDDRLSFR